MISYGGNVDIILCSYYRTWNHL